MIVIVYRLKSPLHHRTVSLFFTLILTCTFIYITSRYNRLEMSSILGLIVLVILLINSFSHLSPYLGKLTYGFKPLELMTASALYQARVFVAATVLSAGTATVFRAEERRVIRFVDSGGKDDGSNGDGGGCPVSAIWANASQPTAYSSW
jgi:hypothetical protein